MLKLEDIIFGKIAVINKLITSNQLEECIHLLESSPTKQKLGDLMLSNGYISQKQYQAVLELQTKTFGDPDSDNQQKLEGVILGKLAVSRGYITEKQLQESLIEQKKSEKVGVHVRLTELLVQKRYLSSSQVREILLSQKIKILYCQQCGKKYNIVGYNEGKPYNCRLCSGTLSSRDEDIILTIEDDLKPSQIPSYISSTSQPTEEKDIGALLQEKLVPAPENFEKFIQRTLYYYQQGNYEEALSQINTALTIDWQDYRAHNLRALIYLKQEAYPEAIEECDRSLSYEGVNPNAYFYRGIAYYNKYLFEKALSDFSEGLIQAQDHPGIIKYTGMCYFKTGKNKEAIQYLNKYIQLAPTASDVREINNIIGKAHTLISSQGKEIGGSTMILVDVPSDKLLGSIQMKDIELGDVLNKLSKTKEIPSQIKEMPYSAEEEKDILSVMSKTPSPIQDIHSVPKVQPKIPPEPPLSIKKVPYPDMPSMKPVQEKARDALRPVSTPPVSYEIPSIKPPQDRAIEGFRSTSSQPVGVPNEMPSIKQFQGKARDALRPVSTPPPPAAITPPVGAPIEAGLKNIMGGAKKIEEKTGIREEEQVIAPVEIVKDVEIVGVPVAQPVEESNINVESEIPVAVIEPETEEQKEQIEETPSLQGIEIKEEEFEDFKAQKPGLDGLQELETVKITISEKESQTQEIYTCPSCKAKVEEEWLYCPFCCAAIYPQPCPRCSREIQPGWKSCPFCGPAILH